MDENDGPYWFRAIAAALIAAAVFAAGTFALVWIVSATVSDVAETREDRCNAGEEAFCSGPW